MSSTSQTYGDADDNQASSSSPSVVGIGSHRQRIEQEDRNHHHHQQQQIKQEEQHHQQQQIHIGINQIPSTIDTQHQQLFPKPHPIIRPFDPTFSSNTGTANNAIATNFSTADMSYEPPHTTTLHHQHQHYPSSATTFPHHSHFAQGEGVEEPRPTDVICGRGKMTASHPANRRFRELVDSHKASYQNSKRRDEKTRITCDLVDKLRGEGRFVLFDPDTKLWHEVSEEYAREKVSHSLRSRSSSEQRNANTANNSIHMLNNSVHQENDTVVNIAPRTEESHGNSNPTSAVVESTGYIPSKISSVTGIHSAPNNININININNTNSKKNLFNILNSISSSGSKPKPTNGSLHHRKKTSSNTSTSTTIKATAHKAHSTSSSSSSSSSTSRSKHSLLRPGLDEVVRCLIRDQQALLRAMIQKETERFTSAAAMGPPPRPMPLSYKAEASAVSILTASLPKMGTPTSSAVVAMEVPSMIPALDTSSSWHPFARIATADAARTMTTMTMTATTTTNPLVGGNATGTAGSSASTSGAPNESPSCPATVTVPAI